mmetsp:Transcript_17535/g.43711  ORF Transcript_17535/g.43711 Transcript_17535/m.43711 type:complete len:240 (+) Transcript_17535:2192-2911(+)
MEDGDRHGCAPGENATNAAAGEDREPAAGHELLRGDRGRVRAQGHRFFGQTADERAARGGAFQASRAQDGVRALQEVRVLAQDGGARARGGAADRQLRPVQGRVTHRRGAEAELRDAGAGDDHGQQRVRAVGRAAAEVGHAGAGLHLHAVLGGRFPGAAAVRRTARELLRDEQVHVRVRKQPRGGAGAEPGVHGGCGAALPEDDAHQRDRADELERRRGRDADVVFDEPGEGVRGGTKY